MRNFSNKTNSQKVRFFNTVEPVAPLYQDLIPYWLKLGWQVEVIISRSEYREDSTTWKQEGVTIRRTPAFGFSPTSTNKLAKPIIMLAYIISAAFKSLFGPRVDKNIFLTQPPLFFVWGWVLQKTRKQPYVIVSMDIYPDVAIRAGMLNPHSLAARILTRLSRFGLRKANGIIVIGRCMKERMIAAGVTPERIHLATNWTDPGEIHPIPPESNSFRLQNQWQDRFVILYSGNIGVSHYFDDIMEVARRLLHKYPKLLFVFIGNGRRRREILEAKEKYHLDNVLLLPFQEKKTLSLSLSAGDVHFVSLRDGFEGLVVPSKTYAPLAAGRPVIYQGDPGGEIAQMITEENTGTIVPLHSPDRLEQAIINYLENPKLAEDQGRTARQVIETTYNSQAACQKYTSIIRI